MKQTIRIKYFTDKIEKLTYIDGKSDLPGDISYSILSSVRSSIDLISVCASAVTPAHTISDPETA